LAVDLIVTADTGMIPTEDELLAGNILLNWLTDHGDDLKIHGIVFSRDSKMRPEFWGYSHPGTWKEGDHREGKDEGEEISANHVDHITSSSKVMPTGPHHSTTQLQTESSQACPRHLVGSSLDCPMLALIFS
jgi:hypothetical protein